MKNEKVPVLKKEVEQVFGRKIISYRDCIQLSEEIFTKTGFKINVNTLRRIFGLVKTSYFPSLATQNILSKYCGFSSVDEINSSVNKDISVKQIEKENVIHYLVSLFKDVNIKEQNDTTYFSIVHLTINFLNRNPQLIDKFQRQIAKTPNGQYFYFENSINIDQLNGYYGDGLRYYLNEKSNNDSKIFAHALLVFRYWLTMDDEQLEKNISHLLENKINKVQNSFIAGRYFASLLYYNNAKGTSAEKVLADARKFYYGMKPGKDEFLFTGFEIIFSEALILTANYEEGLFYIRGAAEKITENLNTTDGSFYRTFNLLEALALYKLEIIKRADVFQQIKPSSFHPFSRNYDMIIYMLIARKIYPRNSKYKNQLSALVEVSGFKRLIYSEVTAT